MYGCVEVGVYGCVRWGCMGVLRWVYGCNYHYWLCVGNMGVSHVGLLTRQRAG